MSCKFSGPVGASMSMRAAAITSLGVSSFQQVQRRIQHRDSRLEAVEWLQQHVENNETILALRDLSILPAEWDRISAKTTVVPWTDAIGVLERNRFNYIVTGEFDLGLATDRNALALYRDRWKEKLSNCSLVAEFGKIETQVVPFVWRTNDERILILKGNPL